MRLIDADTLYFYMTDSIEQQKAEDARDEAPTIDAISRELYEQILWERDVALSQLKRLNIELGEKPYLKAIPIDWIVNWLTRQTIPALHTCDEYDAVNMMLDDWEKENEIN